MEDRCRKAAIEKMKCFNKKLKKGNLESMNREDVKRRNARFLELQQELEKQLQTDAKKDW